MAHANSRRARGGGGHGGGGGHDAGGSGRWLLTYADLITLLMVFFVVLYSMANVDAQKYAGLSISLRKSFAGPPQPNANKPGNIPPGVKPEDLQQDGAFNVPVPKDQTGGPPPTDKTPDPPKPPDPEPAKATPKPDPKPPSTKPAPSPLQATANALAGTGAANSGQVTVKMSSQGLVISILGSVLFTPGGFNLRPEAESVLKQVADKLKDLPNEVAVSGFSDGASEGQDSWDLSSRRAARVVNWFVGQPGMRAQRFMAIGYGDSRSGGDPAARRVDVVVFNAPDSKP